MNNLHSGHIGKRTGWTPVLIEFLGRIILAGRILCTPHFVSALIILLLKAREKCFDCPLLAPVAKCEIERSGYDQDRHAPQNRQLDQALPPLVAFSVGVQVPGHTI